MIVSTYDLQARHFRAAMQERARKRCRMFYVRQGGATWQLMREDSRAGLATALTDWRARAIYQDGRRVTGEPTAVYFYERGQRMEATT